MNILSSKILLLRNLAVLGIVGSPTDVVTGITVAVFPRINVRHELWHQAWQIIAAWVKSKK